MKTGFKNAVKAVICIILCLAALASVSCAKSSQIVSRRTVQEYTEKFFELAREDDLKKMEELLHPSSRVELEEYLRLMRNNYKIDLSSGAVISQYSGYTAVNYDGSVDGAYGEITARINTTTNIPADVVIRVVKNADGEGIYSLKITRIESPVTLP